MNCSAKPLSIPVQELIDRLVVRDPGVPVPDRNRKKLKEPFGGFRANISNNRWNLEWFGFVKDQRPL
jgi:hypothetical protein